MQPATLLTVTSATNRLSEAKKLLRLMKLGSSIVKVIPKVDIRVIILSVVVQYALESLIKKLSKYSGTGPELIARMCLGSKLEEASKLKVDRTVATNICYITAVIADSYGYVSASKVIQYVSKQNDLLGESKDCIKNAVVGLRVGVKNPGSSKDEYRELCEKQATSLYYDRDLAIPEETHPFSNERFDYAPNTNEFNSGNDEIFERIIIREDAGRIIIPEDNDDVVIFHDDTSPPSGEVVG